MTADCIFPFIFSVFPTIRMYYFIKIIHFNKLCFGLFVQSIKAESFSKKKSESKIQIVYKNTDKTNVKHI